MGENSQAYCRIWAIEQDPNNGTAHWCHAGAVGLKGNIYPKESIDQVLDQTPTECSKMKWQLVRCRPLDETSACNSCKYKPYINCPGYFHE